MEKLKVTSKMIDGSMVQPVLDECPGMMLKIYLTDGRDFTVLRSRVVGTSGLLHRWVSQENERLSKEFEAVQKSQSRQHSGSDFLPEEDVRMVQELEHRLEATKFTEYALNSLQQFWDKGRFLDDGGVLERMMEMLVACSYLEMNDVTESYRTSLIDVLGTAPNAVVARRRFHLEENYFTPPVNDPNEKFYAELFIKSWKTAPKPVTNPLQQNVEAIQPVTSGDSQPQVSGNANPVQQNLETSQPLISGDFQCQVPGNFEPDVHALQSSIAPPPVVTGGAAAFRDDVVCPTNGKNAPPEIIERSRQVIEAGQDKSSTCACCGGMLILLRRHTCRACCCQMCSSCSEYVLLGFEPRAKGYNLVSRVNEMVQGKSYVCKKCTAILKEIGLKYSLWSQAMFAASLSPDMACRAGCISKEWYEGAKDYVFRFRRLQNRLPTKKYLPEEKNIIWMNRKSFAGHPLWLIQLLRVADWDSAAVRREVYDLILTKKTVASCESLLCSKSCTHAGLRPIDCLVALNGNLFPLPQIIRCALVSILNTATDEELLDYIPFLVHYLRFDEFPFDAMPVYEPGDAVPTSCLVDEGEEISPIGRNEDNYDEVNCDKSPLTHMLMNRCLHHRERWDDTWRQLCFEFYWALSVEVSAGGYDSGELRDYAYTGLYNHVRNSLVAQLQLLYPEGTQMLHAISSQYALVDMLKDTKKAKRNISVLGDRCTLFLPFDSSQTVRSIDMDQCKEMKSAKKPVILPCLCVPTSSVLPDRTFEESPSSSKLPPKEEKRAFMYKLDDLRNDLVVMKCTSIIRKLFESVKELQVLPIVTYRVLPVTKSSGFIELVSGQTVSKASEMGPLSEYLLERVNKSGGGGTTVFIQSAAVASVLCYVFGIGDRHLDNLMVTDKGELVNIDFGFLEGKDTMNCPYARIPDDVINYGNNKKIFDDWCVCVFLQLRRFAMHFHSLMMFLHTAEEDSVSNIQKFDEFIQSRFCVECDESEAVDRLKEFLRKSRESAVSNGVRDWLHTTGRGMKDSLYSYWCYLTSMGKTEEAKSEGESLAAAAAAAASAAQLRNESSNKLGKSIIFSESQRSFRAPGASRRVLRNSPPVVVQPVIPQSSSARLAPRPAQPAAAAAAAAAADYDMPVRGSGGAAAAAAADYDVPVQGAAAAAAAAPQPGKPLQRVDTPVTLHPASKRTSSPEAQNPAPMAPLDASLTLPRVDDASSQGAAAAPSGDLDTGNGFVFSNDDSGSGFAA